MKNKIILLIIILTGFTASQLDAQTFGNEWINYNQTYYKFKVYKDSIYRISIPELAALGLPSTVNGANLQVFRDGQEIPIFVSSNTTLTTIDYIEFYGEKANGKIDALLYKNTNLQLNPDINLISDTAFYFITYNASTNNKRFDFQANTILNPPIKEAYFWNKQKINYRGEFSAGSSDANGGTTNPALYNLNSSQYEQEGYVKKFTTYKDSTIITCSNPYLVSGGPFGYFKSNIVGKNFFTNHQMKIYANNNLIADSAYGSFDIKRFNLSVPMTYLNAQNKITFVYQPVLNANDRFGISSAEFRYPSLFNFENKVIYTFELEPKLTDYYLEITNFNNAGIAPKLYDLTSNKYLIGEIATGGLIKFLIPSSTQIKKLVLINQANTVAANVIGLENVTFKNYSSTTNQGDYIMLTHQAYTNDGNGNNYINDYKNYRESSNGGSYQVALAYTSDINNEFGYGYDYSSLAIKNFLNYAKNNSAWITKPKQVFIVGKGINYYDYLKYKAAPYSTFPFYAVPSFGHPCSDLMLTDFTKTNKPEISIGRLSAFSATDIKTYLDKVKDYEAELNNTLNQNSISKLWQKRVLHIAGTKDLDEQLPISASLMRQKSIIESPFYGGIVTTIKKGSTSIGESLNSKQIDDLVNNGVSLIQFFGHSSSSSIDYNLDLPEYFNNYKKYFVFIANGCGAGNIFEATGQKLLSERFVLAPNKAAIAFIANVNTGFSGTLGTYTDSLYTHFAKYNYGKTIGEQLQKNVYNFMSSTTDPLFVMHCQQILINGDPAIKMYGFAKPDYAVEEDGVNFKQLNLTSTIDSIDVEILIHNLGQYTTDSVSLLIKRVLPNNIEYILENKKFAGIANSDTIRLKIPTYGLDGLGQNYLSVELDQEALVSEISESNNAIKRYFTIYNDDLVPVYPYEFSIVNMQGITLKGSTLNPFAPLSNYILQLDTTEKFNSPLLVSTNIQSKGGVVKWQPTVTLKDKTVYYWRTAKDTVAQNRKWSNSSFIYLDQSLPGWNQSHYYQLQKNDYTDMYLDSIDRQDKYVGTNKKLGVQNVCMGGASPFNYEWPAYFVKIDGSTIYNHGCDPYSGGYSSLQFMVIDTLTGKPWLNYRPTPGVEMGRFGSFPPCRDGATGQQVDKFFEFSFATQKITDASSTTTNATVWRKRIMDFIDSIPQGYYVMIQPRLCVGNCGGTNNVFANNWKADTSLYGSNISLYHKLKNLGFDKIDSFYKNRPMIMWTEKGKPTTSIVHVGADATVKLYAEFNFKSTLFTGNISTKKIGPASLWSEFKENKTSLDATNGDSSYYNIYGLDINNTETLLASVQHDTSLSFINATQYPYLKIVMSNSDNVHKTAEQLNFWRVLYQPKPEAALNPNRFFVYKDTLGQGQSSKISIAVENLTTIPMDSLLVKYSIINSKNQRTLLATKRYKPLPVLDTIIIDYELNTSLFSGHNSIEIEVNPDNDQLEQYHPNNIGLKNIFIVPDNQNPLIDVTFDGIHILDRDIVSAKPFINITLKDENKYLALDDTSLVEVYLRYNASSSFVDERIPFDNQKLKLIPATINSSKNSNQARIEFRPEFTQDDDDYMLILKKAKDKSGNVASINDYKIAFSVLTKPSISALLNYPNPFTTSTQFLFTLTGSEIPSQLKIQILTPTGKMVREITKAELGNIHIGRNLTEFRWKGDDQYGQPLANGVYLYRLVSSLDGNKIDTYKTGADKYIEKGFGKLYIMR